MKRLSLFLALFLCCFSFKNYGCATCVGRLEKDTPPFFTPEYDAYFWPDEDTESFQEVDTSGMVIEIKQTKQGRKQ